MDYEYGIDPMAFIPGAAVDYTHYDAGLSLGIQATIETAQRIHEESYTQVYQQAFQEAGIRFVEQDYLKGYYPDPTPYLKMTDRTPEQIQDSLELEAMVNWAKATGRY